MRKWEPTKEEKARMEPPSLDKVSGWGLTRLTGRRSPGAQAEHGQGWLLQSEQHRRC